MDKMPEFIDEAIRMFAVCSTCTTPTISTKTTMSQQRKLDEHRPHGRSFDYGTGDICLPSSGHIEKYERLNVVRPMRQFGYLDTTINRLEQPLWSYGLRAFIFEVRTLKKWAQVILHRGENNIWNTLKSCSSFAS